MIDPERLARARRWLDLAQPGPWSQTTLELLEELEAQRDAWVAHVDPHALAPTELLAFVNDWRADLRDGQRAGRELEEIGVLRHLADLLTYLAATHQHATPERNHP